jgi:heat shock protein HtpX
MLLAAYLALVFAKFAIGFIILAGFYMITEISGGESGFKSLTGPSETVPVFSIADIVGYVANSPQLLKSAIMLVVGMTIISVLYSLFGRARSGRNLPGDKIHYAEMPDLFDMVENLAIQAGLPTPDIRIVNSGKPNAFAYGLSAKSSSIILTEGLLRMLSPDELQAVLAHEMTHIRQGDTQFMTLAQVCFDAGDLTALIRYYTESHANIIKAILAASVLLFTIYEVFAVDVLILALVWGVVLFLPLLLRPLIAKANAFAADAGAIEITKNPLALATALRKIEGISALPVSGKIISAMMISGPSKGSNATHPPLEERIQAIVRHGGVMVEEYMRAASAIPPPPGIPVAGAPVFGRSGITSGAAPAFGQAPAFRFGHAAAPEAGGQDEKELEAWLDDMGKDRDLAKTLKDMEPYIVGTMVALALIIPILNALFPSLGIFGKFIH